MDTFSFTALNLPLVHRRETASVSHQQMTCIQNLVIKLLQTTEYWERPSISTALCIYATVLVKMSASLFILLLRLELICNSLTGLLSTVHGLNLLGKLKPLLNFLLKPGGAEVQLT